jgi:arsenite-transporting ATPase
LRFFGGKGGVGKTTCAAAAALGAAEAGADVLVVSTDPAHSLGDALAARLGPEPVRIATRRGRLLAVELGAERALRRFLDAHRQALRTLAERGTYLDAGDVDLLLDLSLPGIDELAGLLELSRLARQSGCSAVVVDTAPAGHTLRLLAMPATLRRLAAALDSLQRRHRLLAERFAGVYVPDEGDALIAGIEDEGRELEERLRDPERAAFVWVTLPEALSLAESRDAVAALAAAGVAVHEIVINRVTPRSTPEVEVACPLCRQRRRCELAVIRQIREAFPGRPLRFLPAEPREPRGLPGLRRIARHLADPARGEALAEESAGERRSARKRNRAHPSRPRWLDSMAPPGLRLLLFGGKGGVGKTTCAAAAALALAEHRPQEKVLLVSADPAHSLADVLEIPLGDDERPVPGAPPGLRARELDAVRAYEAWRRRHGGEVLGGVEALAPVIPGEGEAFSNLLAAPPPGVDELLALAFLLDTAGEEDEATAGGLVVLDTAPTGHALRLLAMPEVALAWDHALLSLLLKYREALGLGGLAAGLVELSRGLKRLRSALSDAARTRFVVVSRGGELPRRETARLLRALSRLSIAVPVVLLNAAAETPCPRCSSAAAREAAALRERCRCAIMAAPAVFPPPRGVDDLAGWARTWKETWKETG